MALPADFSKIFGSTATGGLTPINNVDYAKGWEFVGSNPPTKNDFSYLQNLSDLKSKWLYLNKLQRTDPFGDIKSDGTVQTALGNLGLGEAAKRNVGTGANQIPDMSAFPSGESWFQLPSGHIVQIFSMSVLGADTNGTSANYPIAFPTTVISISTLWTDSTVANAPTYKLMANATNRTKLTIKVSAGSGTYGTMIIAVGR